MSEGDQNPESAEEIVDPVSFAYELAAETQTNTNIPPQEQLRLLQEMAEALKLHDGVLKMSRDEIMPIKMRVELLGNAIDMQRMHQKDLHNALKIGQGEMVANASQNIAKAAQIKGGAETLLNTTRAGIAGLEQVRAETSPTAGVNLGQLRQLVPQWQTTLKTFPTPPPSVPK